MLQNWTKPELVVLSSKLTMDPCAGPNPPKIGPAQDDLLGCVPFSGIAIS